jgi:hypothetical protein
MKFFNKQVLPTSSQAASSNFQINKVGSETGQVKPSTWQKAEDSLKTLKNALGAGWEVKVEKSREGETQKISLKFTGDPKASNLELSKASEKIRQIRGEIKDPNVELNVDGLELNKTPPTVTEIYIKKFEKSTQEEF